MLATLTVALILLGFAVAICYRPAYVMSLAFCIYPFEQWAQVKSAFFAGNGSAINFAFGFLVLLALLMVVIRGKNPLNPLTPGAVVCFSLFLYAGASCLWSVDSNVSIFMFKFNLPYVTTFIFLVPLVIHDSKDLRAGIMGTLIFGSVLMVMLVTSTTTNELGRGVEYRHDFVNVTHRGGRTQEELTPLALAEMAGTLAIIAILMNYSGSARIWSLLRWGVVLLALLLIVRSGSRGQLIGLAVVPFFVGVSRGRSGRVATILVGAAVFVVGLLIVVFALSGATEVIGNRFQVDKALESFEESRLGMCSIMLSEWVYGGPSAWLFGLGSSASWVLMGIYPHVVVVEVLVELGIVGLLLLSVVTFCCIGDWLKLIKLSDSDKVKRGLYGTLGGVGAYLILLTFKQGSLLTHPPLFMLTMVVFRMAAIATKESKREKARQMKMWVSSQMPMATAS